MSGASFNDAAERARDSDRDSRPAGEQLTVDITHHLLRSTQR